MLRLSVGENMTIPYINNFANKLGMLNKSKEAENINGLINKLNVKTPTPKVLVNNLSGGNQQKIVIAKWLGKKSKIFICFEPTRGIDVEAKAQVYEALEEMRRTGASIIMVSSELSEVMGMSDRIYIMRKGRFVAELNHREFDEEAILSVASGVEV